MLFNTPAFLIFFLLAVPLSFLVPRRWQNFLLLAASYVFYGFSEPKLVLLLLAVTAAAYVSARGISRQPKWRKAWKVLGLAVPLLLLFVFKYFGFFRRILGAVTGLAADPIRDLILPTGISFYTFQALAYVMDVDKGRCAAEEDPWTLALFLSFFPQLVAGPIERAGDLLPQFKKARSFDPESAIRGLRIMLLGFFEKIAVADILGLYVNRVWQDLPAASGADALLATFLFSVQILCDFKGYSDIARGAACVLGIRLSVNFDRPYRSGSVAEFWRRWHITLSSWLRDYLYIPLGGSQGSFLFWARNILIVFLISGLWHGADLTFVAWGLLHALFQILERLIFRKETDGSAKFWRRLLTFLCVNFAWILFRASDFTQAHLFLNRLFSGWGTVTLSASGTELILLSVSLISFLALSFSDRIRKAESGMGKAVRRLSYVLMLWLTLAAYLYLRSGGIHSSFIYFQF